MVEPELRNCPFCGGKAKYESSLYVKPLQDENGAYVDYDEMYYWERTYCTECGAEISSESDDEEEEITIKKWNRMDDSTVNRWISVEDALPEIKEFNISDTVLCYCDSGALAIARLGANGFGQVGFNCEKDDEYHHSAGKVLYWMPIPEIPEPPEKE